MGQRFQVLIQVDDNLLCYHCQWLWSAYAIRRLGSFVYTVQEKIKDPKSYFIASRDLDKCMQWAFLHNLKDQNSIYPYFDDLFLTQEQIKKEESIKGFLDSLDNNNGQFILKIIKEKIVGYAFYNPTRYNEASKENQNKLIDFKEYMKDYKDNLFKEFDKKQQKEYQRAVKIFEKLPLLKDFPNIEQFTQ